MKIPSQFIVKGKVWAIKYKWNLRYRNSPCYGLCNYDERVIYICRSVTDKQLKLQTLLHELFHAFVHELNPEKRFIPIAKDEIIAEGFSEFLLESFKIKCG